MIENMLLQNIILTQLEDDKRNIFTEIIPDDDMLVIDNALSNVREGMNNLSEYSLVKGAFMVA